MASFVAEYKKSAVHWFLFQHEASDRRHAVDAFSEIDWLVHDEHGCLCGDLNHGESPMRHSDDSRLRVSGVCVKIRSLSPFAVSISAIGVLVADGADSSKRENDGTPSTRVFSPFDSPTRRDRSSLVARTTAVRP
jgi:hypothetical protein